MKSPILLTFCIFSVLLSCKTTKKISVEQLNENQIIAYYKSHDIPLEKVLVVKDAKSYIRMSEKGYAEFPKVLMFNSEGSQIDYEQIDYCVANPEEFIKGYTENRNELLKFKDLKISEYLFNLIPLNGEVKQFENSVKSNKKNLVFVNTALYVEKLGINKKSFELSKYNNKDFEIYFVNIDLRDTWQIENVESVLPENDN